MSECTEKDPVVRKLTEKNYRGGFLVDEELMAGVGQEEGGGTGFFAYVLRPETAEYLGYEIYPTLGEALEAINRIPRDWAFENMGGGCGGEKCAEGKCKGEKCKLFNGGKTV